MSDIIDRIDAAVGCQQCTGPLGDSPSSDFCGPDCLEAWHARRTVPLTGYSEPWDLPEHYSNLDGYDLDHDAYGRDFGLWQVLTPPVPEFMLVTPSGIEPLIASWAERARQAYSGWRDLVTRMWEGVAAEFTIHDEITWFGVSPRSEPPPEPWTGLPDDLQQGCHEFEDCAHRGLPWSAREAESLIMPDLPALTLAPTSGPERSRRGV